MKMIDKYIKEITSLLRDGAGDIYINGLPESASAYLTSNLIKQVDAPILILLPGQRQMRRFIRDIEFFLPESLNNSESHFPGLFKYPDYDVSPLSGLSPHRDIICQRMEALYSMVYKERFTIISSINAIMRKTIPKEQFCNAIEYIEKGEELNRDRFISSLEQGGYIRTSLVEDIGDYSVRGGVIDLFPPIYSYPVRIELWGDEIESIRHFDPLTQRSNRSLNEAIILPVSEILWKEECLRRARSMGRLPEPYSEGIGFPGQEAWLNHFYETPSTIFDYMPEDTITIQIEPAKIKNAIKRSYDTFQEEALGYINEAKESGRPFPEIEGLSLNEMDTLSYLNKYKCISMREIPVVQSEKQEKVIQIRNCSGMESQMEIYSKDKGIVSLAPLAEKASMWRNQGYRVILVMRTEQQVHRINEILKNYDSSPDEIVSNWHQVSPGRGISLCQGELSRGFIWHELGLVVIVEDEIFGQKAKRLGTGVRKKGIDWTHFSQLKEGDLIVHEEHGIGRYAGLCKMSIDGKVNEFVVIEYANNDKLYIPSDRISVLQKYIGIDEKNPKIDQLGGRAWKVTKQKARNSIKKIAKQLVEIYAVRKYRKGFPFSPPDNYFREFEATFEHEETPDQAKAIQEVIEDMISERPMDRLICGDVGFGKTEIAIRASFKAVMDGKQVAILVPTTVLAEQHLRTFRRRLSPYNIKIEVLSRFKTPKEQKEIIAKLWAKKIDILIGTHRMLQDDVRFRDLGLLIIDEEQRFGVKQKEKIKKLRATIDILAMTATPIPRTLHMSLLGIRDLSIVETPPEERKSIQTHICVFDRKVIKDAIEFELSRNGQVFFVHNRVQNIHKVEEFLKELVPQARFGVAHGQMSEKRLEQIMLRFLNKEIDVLVCTAIIESGLDIPTANTIIINEADRFGLSQIYQLRGRVGRSNETAFAYLLISSETSLSRDAEKRLKALMDFSHLGAGLHLALHDLRIRGGGNILGFDQSGHISAIGYEMYLKLIEKTIAEIKGEEWHEEINPEININIPAFLPSDYIKDMDVRLNLYRRLSGIREWEELESIKEEIRDRFGAPPIEAENLLKIMAIRLSLKLLGVKRMDVTKNNIVLTFANHNNIDPLELKRGFEKEMGIVRFLSEWKIKIIRRNDNMDDLVQKLKRIANLISLS